MTRQPMTGLFAAALTAGVLAACGGSSGPVNSTPAASRPADAGTAAAAGAGTTTSAARSSQSSGGLDQRVLAINKACVTEVQANGDQGNAANTANFKACLARRGIAPSASGHSNSTVKECVARAAGDVQRLLACGKNVGAQ